MKKKLWCNCFYSCRTCWLAELLLNNNSVAFLETQLFKLGAFEAIQRNPVALFGVSVQ